jgi:hypothetical protein
MRCEQLQIAESAAEGEDRQTCRSVGEIVSERAFGVGWKVEKDLAADNPPRLALLPQRLADPTSCQF